MDPFQTLPVHIIELILKQLPDLPSLYFLHNASPSIASILHYDQRLTVALIEAIITHPYTPPRIQFIIRTITLLKLQSRLNSETESINKEKHISLLPSSLEDFIIPLRSSYFPQPAACYLRHGTTPLTKSLYPFLASLTSSQFFPCRLLALSAYVHLLSRIIINSLLKRCHSLQLRHPADPKYCFKDRFDYAIWLRLSRGAPGPPYTPADIGPPSWSEESRVLLAVWRVVLYFEMRSIYINKELSTLWASDWGETNTRKREGLEIVTFWEDLIGDRSGLIDLETVVEWIFPEAIGTYETVPWDKPPSPFQILSHHDYDSSYYSAPKKPATDEKCNNTDKYDEDGGWRSAFEYAANHMLVFTWSPLYSVDFEIFRPYGFSIWDTKRLLTWELWDTSMRHNPSRFLESKTLFTWRSILSKKQVTELEERRKEHMERHLRIKESTHMP